MNGGISANSSNQMKLYQEKTPLQLGNIESLSDIPIPTMRKSKQVQEENAETNGNDEPQEPKTLVETLIPKQEFQKSMNYCYQNSQIKYQSKVTDGAEYPYSSQGESRPRGVGEESNLDKDQDSSSVGSNQFNLRVSRSRQNKKFVDQLWSRRQGGSRKKEEEVSSDNFCQTICILLQGVQKQSV